MLEEDIGRRIRVFDMPDGQGKGLVGIITHVYNFNSFRIMKDNGLPNEFFDFDGDIQWLDMGVSS